MRNLIPIVALALASGGATGKADFGGTTPAVRAMSPNGNIIIRIMKVESKGAEPTKPVYEVAFYEYQSVEDRFVPSASFRLTNGLSHMVYVSDGGELVLINLSETDSIRLYSKDGKQRSAWKVGDFLSDAEVNACAETGATLQWFEEGIFDGKEFYFRGPSRVIRAVPPPFTIMRGVKRDVTFSGTIDLESLKLQRDDPITR
jgi:hypothetical protein